MHGSATSRRYLDEIIQDIQVLVTVGVVMGGISRCRHFTRNTTTASIRFYEDVNFQFSTTIELNECRQTGPKLQQKHTRLKCTMKVLWRNYVMQQFAHVALNKTNAYISFFNPNKIQQTKSTLHSLNFMTHYITFATGSAFMSNWN
jgi:hypothetical protein